MSLEKSDMKKVWPSEDQNAIVMPNSKKRHSTLINVVVLTVVAPLSLEIFIRRITACILAGWQDVIKICAQNIEIEAVNTYIIY